LVLAFAPYAHAVDYAWDGNGDADNGGNWSDPANWDVGGTYPDDTNDTASLTYPSVDRYVTNDVAVTIDQLALYEGSKNHLVLGADMTVRLVDVATDDGHPSAKIHLSGNTLTVRSGSATYFPGLNDEVGGSLVKNGTETVRLITEDNFTGSMMVNSGVLYFYGGQWTDSSGLTVMDGATAHVQEHGPELPTNVIINGQGYNSAGALSFSGNPDDCASDITLASDSKMKRLDTQTTTLTGEINGSDVLTLEGPGDFKLGSPGPTFSGKLVITNTAVLVLESLPNVTSIWVDAGGVLEALASDIPAATVVETNGGVWLQQPTSAHWTGEGDGSNWTHAANWAPQVVPTNVATIPYPASPRTVVVDAPVVIDQLALHEGSNNRLLLKADMTVRLVDVDAPDDEGDPGAIISLNGNTLSVDSGSASYFPYLAGDGTLVKYGTGTVQLQWNDNYTGTMIVSNGTLQFRAPSWEATALLTVMDGATAWQNSGGGDLPTNIVINGQGYNNGGALQFSVTDSCGSDITLDSDSMMKQANAALTTTLTGDIRGDDVLTLEGPGTWILAGTGVTYTNKLIITNGTVQANGDFPDLKNVLVDAGGVLEALQTQFPSASIVTQNGGVWNEPTSATWTGNGDANNGGNWSDTANWSPPFVPTEQADLRATLSSPRYITNDVATTVDTILMEDDSDNHLVLGANLTVDTLGNEHNISFSYLHVNGHTVTVGRSTSPGNYMPILDGPGLFLKVSTGTATLQGSPDTFTGSFIVSNGTLNFRASQYATTILMTVLDGATAGLMEPGPSFPPNIVINGQGYNGNGALRFSSTSDSCTSDVTVATDSKIVRADANTTTLTGDIAGPGDLTFESASGAFDLDGTYNLAIDGADANSIVVSAGTVDISSATLSISGHGTASEKEYVVIDYSGSGTLAGEFAEVIGLKPSWELVYAGTDDNPDCVVLIAGAKGSMLLVR